MSYNEEFSWVKFLILSVPGVIAMMIFVDGMKWKLMFSLAVPIGVGLALAGKSARRRGN